jgi:hypothetical protein
MCWKDEVARQLSQARETFASFAQLLDQIPLTGRKSEVLERDNITAFRSALHQLVEPHFEAVETLLAGRSLRATPPDHPKIPAGSDEDIARLTLAIGVALTATMSSRWLRITERTWLQAVGAADRNARGSQLAFSREQLRAFAYMVRSANVAHLGLIPISRIDVDVARLLTQKNAFKANLHLIRRSTHMSSTLWADTADLVILQSKPTVGSVKSRLKQTSGMLVAAVIIGCITLAMLGILQLQ